MSVLRPRSTQAGSLATTGSGRTIKYHRSQIRDALGFREATRADEEALTVWLAADVAPTEPSDDRLRE